MRYALNCDIDIAETSVFAVVTLQNRYTPFINQMQFLTVNTTFI